MKNIYRYAGGIIYQIYYTPGKSPGTNVTTLCYLRET